MKPTFYLVLATLFSFSHATAATVVVPPNGDLQAALNAAAPGDTIVLTSGATYTGDFILPVKSGNSYITITSSQFSSPASNHRVSPAEASKMARVRSSSNSAFATAPGAHHYRFLGIEITVPDKGYVYDLVAFGNATESRSEDLPHHFVIDSCYIHGDPSTGSKRGVALNAASITVQNSYVSDFKSTYQDSQALAGWNGPGPFVILNNYLQGAGENVMFGGAAPTLPGVLPSDIIIAGNYFHKPTSWKEGSPDFAGSAWSVKNFLEFKIARRAWVYGNVFENNWVKSQDGTAILMTVRDEGGAAPWAVVQDIRIEYNIVRNSPSAFNILGHDSDGGGYTSRIWITNNLLEDISGRMFLIQEGAGDITFSHNTSLNGGSPMVLAGKPGTNFVITDNIVQNGDYGFFGDGVGTGTAALKIYAIPYTFTGNVIVGGYAPAYPLNNYFPQTLGEVGFYAVPGDYRLSPSSIFRNIAGDGTAAGADIVRLNTLTSTAKSGDRGLTPLSLFGTGVTAPESLALDGSVDLHYRLTGSDDPRFPGPAAIVVPPANGWTSATAFSKWIAPSTLPVSAGTYTYQAPVDLTGYDASTAVFTGMIAADDQVDIVLNGATQGTVYGASRLQPFTLAKGWMAGVNDLRFVVHNSWPTPNPSGLQMSLNGTALPDGTPPVQPPVAALMNPRSAILNAGSSQSFSITITGTTNTAVNWTLTPNIGTFVGGIYTAPANLAADQVVTLKAVSQVDSNAFDTAAIRVIAPTPAPVFSANSIKVYGTGVAASGTALAPDGATDPHYSLIASADASAPGPNAYVVTSTGFPFPLWIAGGSFSKWISPIAPAANGNSAGSYTYRTTFDLTGFDPSTAKLSGGVAADNSAVILLNGSKVAGPLIGFSSLAPFNITNGFRPGVNTLDFVVTNDPFSGLNPTGLRVVVSGTVSNAPVVQTKAFTLYNTGTTATGALVPDGGRDPHYELIGSPDPLFNGPEAYVAYSGGYPFPEWLVNGTQSKWIAPQPAAGNGSSAGQYTYRTTFDLTGLRPSTATIQGQLACDDTVVIKLNGMIVAGPIGGQGSFTSFTIGNGFTYGINFLDFVVTNAPKTGFNPTGLRVEMTGTTTP